MHSILQHLELSLSLIPGYRICYVGRQAALVTCLVMPYIFMTHCWETSILPLGEFLEVFHITVKKLGVILLLPSCPRFWVTLNYWYVVVFGQVCCCLVSNLQNIWWTTEVGVFDVSLSASYHFKQWVALFVGPICGPYRWAHCIPSCWLGMLQYAGLCCFSCLSISGLYVIFWSGNEHHSVVW